MSYVVHLRVTGRTRGQGTGRVAACDSITVKPICSLIAGAVAESFLIWLVSAAPFAHSISSSSTNFSLAHQLGFHFNRVVSSVPPGIGASIIADFAKLKCSFGVCRRSGT